MKANPDKCHFLSSLDMNTKISVSSFDIENTHSQKLLGVAIDRKLNFHDHVSNLCKKASAKIRVISRVFTFMPTSSPEQFPLFRLPLIAKRCAGDEVAFMLLNQRKLKMKSISMSLFGHCPLVWMNCNRTLNNRINSLL